MVSARMLTPSRFAVVLCTAFLSLTTGCRKTDTAPSPNDRAASQGGADIQVLGTTRPFANADERVTFASALPEVGFFAAAGIRGGAAFAYKLSNNGDVVWRTPLPEHTRATSGGTTNDGQHWLGGSVGDSKSDA